MEGVDEDNRKIAAAKESVMCVRPVIIIGNVRPAVRGWAATCYSKGHMMMVVDANYRNITLTQKPREKKVLSKHALGNCRSDFTFRKND